MVRGAMAAQPVTRERPETRATQDQMAALGRAVTAVLAVTRVIPATQATQGPVEAEEEEVVAQAASTRTALALRTQALPVILPPAAETQAPAARRATSPQAIQETQETSET